MDNISLLAIYADNQTSKSCIPELKEALDIFNQFPWKKEFEKSKTTGICPIILFIAREDNESYINIRYNEDKTYKIDIEIIFNKGIIGELLKKTAQKTENALKKEEVKEYIRIFFKLNRKEIFEKIKLP